MLPRHDQARLHQALSQKNRFVRHYLKLCQFTALIGAAEAAPFQSKCKLYLYRFSLRVDRMFRRSVDLSVGARTGWRGVGTSDERQNK